MGHHRVERWFFVGACSIAGCSGALTAEPPSDDAAVDASSMCPAPADIHSGAPCDYVGPACRSFESPWPPECGDRGGPRAPCVCYQQQWTCSQVAIACVDAGPPVEDARPDPPDASQSCPPPDQVRSDGICSPSFLSCPSIENKIPACIGGYEPTTCHCLSKQWSCEVYGLPCPDTGVRDVANDTRDARGDRSDALDAAPGDEDASSSAVDSADSSDDAGD